jgi:hypothetical protein
MKRRTRHSSILGTTILLYVPEADQRFVLNHEKQQALTTLRATVYYLIVSQVGVAEKIVTDVFAKYRNRGGI